MKVVQHINFVVSHIYFAQIQVIGAGNGQTCLNVINGRGDIRCFQKIIISDKNVRVFSDRVFRVRMDSLVQGVEEKYALKSGCGVFCQERIDILPCNFETSFHCHKGGVDMTKRPVRAFFQNQMEQAFIRVRQVVKLNTVYAFRCTHVDRE